MHFVTRIHYIFQSLPLEVGPDTQEKKTGERGMFFRGGRGTPESRKGCQNHEKWGKNGIHRRAAIMINAIIDVRLYIENVG